MQNTTVKLLFQSLFCFRDQEWGEGGGSEGARREEQGGAER